MLGEVVLRFFKFLGRMQQRLGRNAAYVEACAAERAALIDTRGFEAKLCGADCSNIAARAGANNDQVKM